MTTYAQTRSKCTPATDLALVDRFHGGDREAIRSIFQIHYGLIRYWVREVLTWADDEEIMEEARVGLYEAIRKFKNSAGNFHSHIRTFIRRTVYKSREVRRVNRTLYGNFDKVAKAQAKLIKEFKLSSVEEIAKTAKLSVRQVKTALHVVAAFPDPLEKATGVFAVEDLYQKQLIKDALKQLNPAEAQLIISRYHYGYTDLEIAQALGKKATAIKTARARAELKFKAIISGQA